VRPFVSEYLNGRTPIPCSLCNNHLKFDQLLQTARSIGAQRIATGHYAINEYDPARGRWILKRPADRAKDQTYFLFGLTQAQLARTLFPLGGLTKPEVREAARRRGLALAEKPDSQEICFIPGGNYKAFLDAYMEEQGEPMPDLAGDLVTLVFFSMIPIGIPIVFGGLHILVAVLQAYVFMLLTIIYVSGAVAEEH